MLLAGIALERAFVSSVSRAEGDKLQNSVLLLLAAGESEQGALLMPEVFADSRFNQIGSGLYGVVFGEEGKELWRSPSAILFELPPLAPVQALSVGQTAQGRLDDKRDAYLYAARGVQWESGSFVVRYHFAVLESALPFMAELSHFRQQLWLRLLLAGLFLLLAQLALLRWGLRPLHNLSHEISDIESSKLHRLNAKYPTELEPLANNLNALLDRESEQRLRYQRRLDDLAHSLKTPLAVVNGLLLDDSVQKKSIEEQLLVMDEIVKYQLRRATGRNGQAGGDLLVVDELLYKLQATLTKVYEQKAVTAHWHLASQVLARGDNRDFFELFGNLIDNAYKYCNSELSVELTVSSEASGFTLRVEDDGPGVEKDSRAKILRRGQRLDTNVPGQGIGLAIVIDIVEAYGGRLEIGRSTQLSGAAFVVTLP